MEQTVNKYTIDVVDLYDLLDINLQNDLYIAVADCLDVTFGDASYTLVTPQRVTRAIKECIDYMDYDDDIAILEQWLGLAESYVDSSVYFNLE